MRFQNSVVWITGASSGIGEAVAKEFARSGAHLVLSARRAQELERVRNECEHPDNHFCLAMDLAHPIDFESAVQTVIDRMGHIDIFVHGSGQSQRGSVNQTTLEVDRHLMELNYFAAVGLTKALLPHMLARGCGHLVPISSVAGKLGTPLRSAYCASKHALHGFFESVRAETYSQGLRVTIVCPGYVRTALSENAVTADGSTHGLTDRTTAQGITPKACAQKIVRGIQKEKEEVIVGGKEILVVYLKRLAPRWASRLVRGINQPNNSSSRALPK